MNEHLHNIDEQAHEQLDLLTAQMAKQMDVTEELKASDPMRWVQMMNNIKADHHQVNIKRSAVTSRSLFFQGAKFAL